MQMTRAEYLATEEASEVRREFYDGSVRPIPESTIEHSALSTAVATTLGQQAHRRYTTFSCALRVTTGSDPDCAVVRGRCERDAIDHDSLTNPTLIVEVLGSNTEAYDRGVKFEHYKSINALRQYVLVSQQERLVEVWTRGENGWTSATYRDGEVAALSSIEAQLDIRELYETGAIR